jgi:hypothetical protein
VPHFPRSLLNALDLPAIAHDPERLNRLSPAELRALWGRCCPKSPPSPHRGMLIRALWPLNEIHKKARKKRAFGTNASELTVC